jgi:uncharacterized RDD family membrane protein YckC
MESETANHNPYAAPQSPLAAQPPSLRQEPAGRAIRLGAVLIDNVLFTIAFLPGYLLLLEEMPVDTASILQWIAPVTGLLGLGLLGYNLWLLHRQGQTLAKSWLGIRIVRADGSRSGLGRIFWLRYFFPTLIGAIPCVGGIFSLVDALFIFADDRRCLHDHMADTMVVLA